MNDAITQELQQLEQEIEPLGKSLAQRWGLSQETIEHHLQGAV